MKGRNAEFFLPVALRVGGRECVVVGGGRVAARKVRLLQQAGAKVKVVAESVAPAIAALGVRIVEEAVRREHLQGAFLVVAASDNPSVNRQVAEWAEADGRLVNVVDAPALCSFIFPAVLRRGRLTVAVSTGGASPALAARVRDRLADLLPPQYATYVDILAELRREALQKVREPRRRRRLLQQLAEERWWQMIREGKLEEARAAMADLLETAAAEQESD